MALYLDLLLELLGILACLALDLARPAEEAD
jgi:hypothetical protein